MIEKRLLSVENQLITLDIAIEYSLDKESSSIFENGKQTFETLINHMTKNNEILTSTIQFCLKTLIINENLGIIKIENQLIENFQKYYENKLT